MFCFDFFFFFQTSDPDIIARRNPTAVDEGDDVQPRDLLSSRKNMPNLQMADVNEQPQSVRNIFCIALRCQHIHCCDQLYPYCLRHSWCNVYPPLCNNIFHLLYSFCIVRCICMDYSRTERKQLDDMAKCLKLYQPSADHASSNGRSFCVWTSGYNPSRGPSLTTKPRTVYCLWYRNSPPCFKLCGSWKLRGSRRLAKNAPASEQDFLEPNIKGISMRSVRPFDWAAGPESDLEYAVSFWSEVDRWPDVCIVMAVHLCFKPYPYRRFCWHSLRRLHNPG